MYRLILLVSLFLFAFEIPARAAFNVLHSFNGNAGDGYNPIGTLYSAGGTLYGMTNNGGSRDVGTIFRMDQDGGNYNVLHSFHVDASDGAYPWYGGLTQDGTTLYGMTQAGGMYTGGTIFKIGVDGSGYNVLHSFLHANGESPYGSLWQSGQYFYGMAAVSGEHDYGTIFRVSSDGAQFDVLHSFTGDAGAYPHGSLVQSGSTLYGMTTGFQGGLLVNAGTVFRMEADGTGFTQLHAFDGANGGLPYGSLVEAGSMLYGVTYGGGSDSSGTIFRIGTDGAGFEVLHSFGGEDGSHPNGSLLLSGSKLYGSAIYTTGVAGAGTLFEIGTDGSGFQVLHSFSGVDGAYPHASLIQVGSTLYGTTAVGGEFADGTVFSIQIPEPSGLALMSFAIALLLRPRRQRLSR